MHRPQNPLASAARAVVSLSDRTSGEGDRCTGDQEQRDRHRQEHVPDHVHAEQVVLVGVDRAGGDPEQQQQAGDPQHRSVDGPLVAAVAQPPNPCEIQEDAEPCGECPQQVEVPRGEPAVDRQLGRKRRTGQDLRRRAHRGEIGCRGRSRATQGGRGTAGKAHERELEGDQPPEAAGCFAPLRVLSAARGRSRRMPPCPHPSARSAACGTRRPARRARSGHRP